jgi:succinyl-CoA synthetase alpha subunit
MEEYRPLCLDTAIKMLPDAKLVVISIPGAFAAEEARKALEKNLHVMLFSNHVSLEDEIELKKIAYKKGLLMMGPGCGTAIINARPLCFANTVRRGNIGIIGASGTGIQEVCCNIDKLGEGISQVIGTGGRDLKSDEVGGMMTLMGIEALKNDPDTMVIVVISKPPAESVSKKVISKLKGAGKPCVIAFIGLQPSRQGENLCWAKNLEEAAGMAVAFSKGEDYKPHVFTISDGEVEELVKKETSRMKKGQKYLRGLFTGGTLAHEAMTLFEAEGYEIYSNIQTKSFLFLKDPSISRKHTMIDLGDDVFTVGRPHPMIEPSIRGERLLKEIEDLEVAVILMDIVLGYGSHIDPAGTILESITEAKKRAEKRGGYLSVVTSITGTERDFQNLKEQKERLERIGCVVMPSNAQASMLALKIIKKVT